MVGARTCYKHIVYGVGETDGYVLFCSHVLITESSKECSYRFVFWSLFSLT